MKELKEPKRLCVISKATFGEYAVRDIQTSDGWVENPYGEEYAIVPDELVQDIMATSGWCDIALDETGTEVVSFTAREAPVIPEVEAPISQLDRIEAQVAYTAMMTDTLIEA